MESVSIHPGVKGGKRIHALAHTNKPRGVKAKKLDKKLRRLNQRQVARGSSISSSKIKPEAFKQPGSMNQHKR